MAQTEVVTESLNIDQIRPQFESALRMFKSVEREGSLQLFEKIVADLESRPARNEDEDLMLLESLKHLAVLTFPDKTEEYFNRMIHLNPGSEIQAGTMSPKFIRMFNDIKSKITGTLLVKLVEASDPSGQLLSGGKLLIDGVFTGLVQAGIPIPVLAGSHEITIDMPNFDPFVQTMQIAANGSQVLNGSLFRNAADLGFVTSPQGIKVFVNGVEAGITEGEAPVDYADYLHAEGLSPAQASSVFSINNVKAGSYDIRFQKPCYQTRTITVPIEELKSYNFKPVILKPSRAYITVHTVTPTPGIVYLNHERLGSLPLLNKQVCPGSYQLRVQFPDGQYVKTLNIEENEQIELNAKPQPSMAWFGIQEKEGRAPDQSVDQWLHNLKTWNVLDVDSTDSTIISHDPFSILFNTSHQIDEQGRILTQEIKADLFVAGRVIRKKTIIRYLQLAFWSPLSTKVKTYDIDFRDLNRLKTLFHTMDLPLTLLTPWLGVETIQLKGQSGLKIQMIHPNGPLAGLAQPGQKITAFNNALVNHPKELVTSNFNPVTLNIANKAVQVTPIPAIIELPFTPRVLCPQAVIARLDKISRYAEKPLLRSSAKFNLARYFFFMNDFQQAFDLFTTIEFPNDYGISRGTLLFYQGLCFQRLNLKTEAGTSFNKALSYPKATLFGPNGPKVKTWAKTQLTIISSP